MVRIITQTPSRGLRGSQRIDCIETGFQSLDTVPFRTGVPKSWTSDLEKFEAPDPAEWCPRGYAIVNVDPRGVGDSEGDIFTIGSQVTLRSDLPIRHFLTRL